MTSSSGYMSENTPIDRFDTKVPGFILPKRAAPAAVRSFKPNDWTHGDLLKLPVDQRIP
jgi:hypothetical protein